MLTDTDIEKMMVLYKKHFGIDLDKDEARNKLNMLVEQVQLTYRPITKIQLQKLADEDNERSKDEQIRSSSIR